MKNKMLWAAMFAVLILIAGGAAAWSQTVVQGHKTIRSEVTTGEAGSVVTLMSTGDPQSHVSTYTFVASEMGFESKVVKGLPFSADTVTEFTQILGNGQRIFRSSTAALYRDGEGRTRREQAIDAIGPYASSGEVKKSIFINDPVAGVSYTLNPTEHVAVKTVTEAKPGSPQVFTWTAKSGETGAVSAGTGTQVHVTTEKYVVNDAKAAAGTQAGVGRGVGVGIGGGVMGGVAAKVAYETTSRTEPLGTQMMEGVAAEGTRTIETIPAGAIGNDTPIEIVSERWYSQELGMVVKTVRNDPLSGQNVYQLKNIRRGEPSPDLFQLPADYAVRDSVIIFQSIKK